jgi:hypothetical protein
MQDQAEICMCIGREDVISRMPVNSSKISNYLGAQSRQSRKQELGAAQLEATGKMTPPSMARLAEVKCAAPLESNAGLDGPTFEWLPVSRLQSGFDGLRAAQS